MTHEEVEEEWMREQFDLFNLCDISTELWNISEMIFDFRRKTQYVEGSGLLLRRGFENLYDILVEKISSIWNKVRSCQNVFVELLEAEDNDNVNGGRKMYVYCRDLLNICDKFLEEIEEIKDHLDQS